MTHADDQAAAPIGEPLPLVIPGDEAAGQGATGAAAAPEAKGLTIDKDQFFSLFGAAFPAANWVIVARGGQPLQALDRAAALPSARAASDAIFDTLNDFGVIAWLSGLSPEWLARLAAIGLFGQQLAMAIKLELDQRRAQEAKVINPKAAAA